MVEIEYLRSETSRVIERARGHLLVWGICWWVVSAAWGVGALVILARTWLEERVTVAGESEWGPVQAAMASGGIGLIFGALGREFFKARGEMTREKVLGVYRVQTVIEALRVLGPAIGLLLALVVGLLSQWWIGVAIVLAGGCGIGGVSWWTLRILKAVEKERAERQTEENRGA